MEESELKIARKMYKPGDKTFQGDKTGWFLEQTDEKNYKVYEFGNHPLDKDFKPKGGIWRQKLPCDADWMGKEDPEERAERERKKLEEKERLRKLMKQKKIDYEERQYELREEQREAEKERLKEEYGLNQQKKKKKKENADGGKKGNKNNKNNKNNSKSKSPAKK